MAVTAKPQATHHVLMVKKPPVSACTNTPVSAWSAGSGAVDEAGLPHGQGGHDGEDGQRAADGQLKQGPAAAWRCGQRAGECQRGEHQHQRGHGDQGCGRRAAARPARRPGKAGSAVHAG